MCHVILGYTYKFVVILSKFKFNWTTHISSGNLIRAATFSRGHYSFFRQGDTTSSDRGESDVSSKRGSAEFPG